jgi:putative restriction endonuclease
MPRRHPTHPRLDSSDDLLGAPLAGRIDHLPPARRAEHNMGMPETAERWTAAMVRALPDDRNRYEVIDGELLVTPAPSWPHQWVVGGLFRHLANYLHGQSWGEVVMSPADISFHEDMLVQPIFSSYP